VSDLPSFLSRCVLGPEGRHRWPVLQSLLALMAYALLALGQQSAVRSGLIDGRASGWLSAACLSAATLVFIAIRSGWSQRRPDPSLTLLQSGLGLLAVVWAYGIGGPVRGALLTLPLLILMFSMLRLGPRQIGGLALATLLLLGAVMAWQALHDPARHEPRIELLHMVCASLGLAGVWMLSQHLDRLRNRLARQRSELMEALERIGQIATRDDLTGLPNRRAVMERLLNETARQTRLGRPIALVMIDLDHLKRINDDCGRSVGDAVLRGFADRALTELRGPDLMGRWGGEEFLLVLPDTTVAQATLCVQRLRERLMLTPFDEVRAGLRLTFSAGITRCLGGGDIEFAIERADRAMQRAKAGGRDRTEQA
jgi:diguanylate cyclase (GGDEF)-like protein